MFHKTALTVHSAWPKSYPEASRLEGTAGGRPPGPLGSPELQRLFSPSPPTAWPQRPAGQREPQAQPGPGPANVRISMQGIGLRV